MASPPRRGSGRRTIGIWKTPTSGMVSWTAAPCWTDSMRRMRLNVPSCGEVQKTKYGRPRGSDSVQAAGKVGRRGTFSTLTRYASSCTDEELLRMLKDPACEEYGATGGRR